VELFSLVSFLALLIVGTMVGARLLFLASRNRKLPELAIGTACYTMAVGGVLITPILHLADSGEEGLVFASTIAARSVFALGASAVCVLTWRVFRPGSLWAAAVCVGASLAMAVAVLVQGLRGDATSHWAPLLENYVYMWVRVAAFLWTGLESLRYAGMMRRQLRIGLGDPLVAARIHLWGVAGVSIAAMLAFWALAPPLGHASVLRWSAGMFVANALGLVAAGSLHLAFLPPVAWRCWIEQRAVS